MTKQRYRWSWHFGVWVRIAEIAPPGFPLWIKPSVPISEHDG
jgi:hypothetical protein